jgi:hypothetical protein
MTAAVVLLGTKRLWIVEYRSRIFSTDLVGRTFWDIYGFLWLPSHAAAQEQLCQNG